ncbi:SAM-dependent methyltransferase [Cerasicoccus fimbriatus]|uniref:SAM-dependent methyltransferase n=1 Tax=Cerasicoccus fimbriatus TaxID=3014554 RepID=UPI0022B53449|nr:SAM-dependent methyltransferase [Cerasicoccus sp. TK19100]
MPKCEPWLADIIQREGGAITFAQFMGFALYDPDHGYYGSQVRQVGKTGDFSTSATLCPAFGEAIARWAMARAEEDFPNGDFHLIEAGAGVGALAESVLKAWRALGGPAVPYSAVETSPGLRKALAPKARELGFTVHDGMPDALEAADGHAIIFSNELVDAFPARQLCWDGEDWREVGLRLQGDELVEGLLPFTDAVDADAPARPRDGQRIFIHPSYHAWLEAELADWRRGRMLTIDYGAAYPAGEVRAYRNQEGINGDAIYAHAGQQDLTCDVNFADLQRWGEQLGWQTVGLLPQVGFLEQWLPDAEARAKDDPALAFLANPFGAGGAFQTLEQRVEIG